MASTPSNRHKLAPAASPFVTRTSRSPGPQRSRTLNETCLSLRRVIGTTCSSPTGFDSVHSSFAYIAGGAVVVVDVSGEHYSQRFYRARPSAVPVFALSPVSHTTAANSNPTPKANDSRNRTTASQRESAYQTADSSQTWTSRERIKAATCLGLSRDGRYLAVGETGYAPRVLIFNLQDASSDTPLVSISEHAFGVKAVAWSPDTRFLASLGAANDGFLYIWKIDTRTGAARLFQQNRCTSHVKGMVWMGNNLITLGVRHIKVWRVEEPPPISPTKSKFSQQEAACSAAQLAQKPLPGRNILLGSMLDATFSCALALDENRAIICSETGSVCLLDDTNKQMKLTRLLDLNFHVSCISMRKEMLYVGGKDGQLATLALDGVLEGIPDPVIHNPHTSDGLVALGFLAENFVTIDNRRTINIWSPDHIPAVSSDDPHHIPIPGAGDIVGIQELPGYNGADASFVTWSASGRINLWNMDGLIKLTLDVPVDQVENNTDGEQPVNQLVVVRATKDGSLFAVGDKLGVLRIIDASTRVCLLETKAHSSDCQDITIFEDESKLLIASCGRDRTAQLFHRTSSGAIEHFQTLEFSAKVVQVLIPSRDKVLTCSLDRTLQIHDLVSKESDPDVMAAIPSRVITLRASPSSMVVTPFEKSIFVSLLDRSVCHFDYNNGRLLNSFKCNDEGGSETVILESLRYGTTGEMGFLLGISNTDKSIRVYDAQSGAFMGREWGHTEAINGVVMVEGEQAGRKIISVGEDGTIMVWGLDIQFPVTGSRNRDPSPDKTTSSRANNPSAHSRPPLRRVLSKAELAEFQRPSSSHAGSSRQRRLSPGRIQSRRSSQQHAPISTTRTPVTSGKRISPDGTGSIRIKRKALRRTSSGAGSRSESPPSEDNGIYRRCASPPLINGDTTPTATSSTIRSSARKKSSLSNLRSNTAPSTSAGPSSAANGYGFGSLSAATEQTCRQLRAYRKKLASPDAISGDILAELDAELRLTAAALGERAIRSRSSRRPHLHQNHHSHSYCGHDRDRGHSHGHDRGGEKALSEGMLTNLLDQYSERLVSMLDEKLRMRLLSEEEREAMISARQNQRPRTSGEGSTSSGASGVTEGRSGSSSVGSTIMCIDGDGIMMQGGEEEEDGGGEADGETECDGEGEGGADTEAEADDAFCGGGDGERRRRESASELNERMLGLGLDLHR
ncbi:quinon protein alcohol dehydrogenase-like superfamily [Sordaria sp. MPI-SDFR-AT-0083]|nr:quinon protein alcohol dehydrogenase-like superfamily [Sordaria sp. MPI-SDFR-AT-0083]